MLYLEDYLEMIEHLPNELRERFTEMREIDLGVENMVDSLEARQKAFFTAAAKYSTQQREEEYNKIKKDYNKVIDEANEKIHIADECYGLVDRYLRKLDQELHKFQLELEADNRGITEVLEKRSLELDAPPSRPTHFLNKENRAPKRNKNTTAHGAEKQMRRDASGAGPSGLAGLEGSSPYGSQSMFPLEQMGAGSSAIAAAASQALAATHYNVPGRRSSSLKASMEAISQGVATRDLSIGQELAAAATSALAATTSEGSSNKKQKVKNRSSATNSSDGPSNKKQRNKNDSSVLGGLGLDMMGGSLLDDMDPSGSGLDSLGLGGAGSPGLPHTPGGDGSQGSDQEWNYDPNEPRYCICNQVSYGEMVACDNEHCPYEWFHYPCVGITASPKGKWYCSPCTASMKRRGRK